MSLIVRTNQIKRSRNGCLVCRTARVKCSERRPVCQRCTKFGVHCEWPRPGPSLRDVRRGYGPLKRRDKFTPKELAPLPSEIPDSSNPRDARGLVSVASSKDDIVSRDRGEEPTEGIGQNNLKTNQTLGLGESVSNPIEPPLSTYHIPSSSSITLQVHDHAAMHHYHTTLCSPSSFRNPKWFSFSIILRFSSSHPALMHLMLAASFAQMSHATSRKWLWLQGKAHFRAGSRCLIEGMRGGEGVDHCRNVEAFWLLQFVFRTMWGPGAAESMGRLSRGVARYMGRHGILDLYSSPKASSASTTPTYLTSLGRVDSIVLATFILWNMYEDVEAEFCRSGGYFAGMVCGNGDVASNVFNSAQISLELMPGSGFGVASGEVKGGTEYERAFELRCQSTVMIHRINKAARRWDSVEELSSVREQMEGTLFKKYYSVFELAKHKLHTPTVFMAKRMVLHFYTTYTYCLLYLEAKQRTGYLTKERNVIVYKILDMIEHIIDSSASVQSQWLEWPLLMIGIQVNETEWQDWIRERLVGCRYEFAINEVLRLKNNDRNLVLDIDAVRTICLNVS